MSIRRHGHALLRILSLCFRVSPRAFTLLALVTLLQALMPIPVLVLVRQTTDALVDALDGAAVLSSAGGPGRLLCLLLGVLIAQEFLRAGRQYLAEIHGQRVTEAVSASAYAKSLRMDLSCFERPDHFDRLHRVLTEAPHRPPVVFRALVAMAGSGIALAGIALLVGSVQWMFLPVLVLISVPGWLWGVSHARRIHRHWEQWTADTRRMEYFADVLSRPEFALPLRLFRIGPFFLKRFEEIQASLHRREKKDIFRGVLAESGFAALTLAGAFGVLWWATGNALAGGLSAGVLVMLFQALRRMHGEMVSFVGAGLHLFQNLLFLKQYDDFLDAPEAIEDPAAVPVAFPPDRSRADIRFEQVTFAYPGSGEPALEMVDATIPAGALTVIVGDNGSGKSTFLKLLTRLYDPQSGRILMGGRDVREIPIADYRHHFSVLPQQPRGFSLTVADNIRLGDVYRPGDAETLRRAAERAGALDRIAKLPSGIETPLGKAFEAGAELSAGEWRKLFLARCLYRDAPILLFDEPLVALDAGAEEALIDALTDPSADTTRVVVSHRPELIRRADRILIFARGRVVRSCAGDTRAASGEDLSRLCDE